MRRYVAIFAVLALGLLILRPVCDALALQAIGAQGIEHHRLSQDGNHSSSLVTVANAAQGLFSGPAFLVAALSLAALAFFTRGAAPRAALLPTRSYYARSARILR